MLPTTSWILTEDTAGMRAQALGLAEAAGLAPDVRLVHPRGLWKYLAPEWWLSPLKAIEPEAVALPWPELAIGCGGKAAAVLAALKGRMRVVIVQHPRMPARRFDLVVAARHDELTGPNVLITRTALHRATPARLTEAAAAWQGRLAALPRPLVVVLIGGSNGRFRLDVPVAERLAGQLGEMMQRDRVGIALTPSRRTDPAVRAVFKAALEPLGGWIWNMEGDNPYFGMLGLADAIVATCDSVSMISEAVASSAPVMVAELPGRSRRIGLFTRDLIDAGRVHPYVGRFEHWPIEPMDDTGMVAAEMCRRFGY